jgi:hypothetical protein
MQHVNIKLDLETIDRTAFDVYEQDEITITWLPRQLASGRGTVVISFVAGGKQIGVEMTARNFIAVAGAVRGKMVQLGEIPVALNPGLAISTEPRSGLVHFAAEAPLQTWDYSVEHAKQFWRELRRLADVAQK